MNDDIIAYSYDDQGNKIEMRISEVYQTFYDMTKIMYFDFNVRVPDGDYESFRATNLALFARMLDQIHNTFADHVEGTRKDMDSLSAEKKRKMTHMDLIRDLIDKTNPEKPDA